MITNEMRQYIKQEIMKALKGQSLSSDTANVPHHVHNGTDSSKVSSYDLDTQKGFVFNAIQKHWVQLYQVPATGDMVFINLGDGTEGLNILGWKDINITATGTGVSDNILISKSDGINSSVLALQQLDATMYNSDGTYTGVVKAEPEVVSFQSTSPNFRVFLTNLGATPATCIPGEITIAGGRLYVCEAPNTWVIK